MDFQDVLKQLLEKNHLKQAEVCRLTGIPTSLMSNYMNGAKRPALSNAIKLAQVFGVSLEFLAGDSPDAGKAEQQVCSPSNFTSAEETHMASFRSLNEEGQEKLTDYANDLLQSGHYKKP